MRLVRWTARVLAALSAGFMAIFAVGEGMSGGFGSPARLSPREAILMTAFIVLWLGLLLGWKWELLGGLLTVGATAAFYGAHYSFSRAFPSGPWYLLLASPGVLFLFSWRWSQRVIRAKASPAAPREP